MPGKTVFVRSGSRFEVVESIQKETSQRGIHSPKGVMEMKDK